MFGPRQTYWDLQLEHDDIRTARNNGRTARILCDMYSRLQHLRREGYPPRGELMDKALNYMPTYWKQLTAWPRDGRSDIDNTLAERHIRPLSGERKNSLLLRIPEDVRRFGDIPYIDRYMPREGNIEAEVPQELLP